MALRTYRCTSCEHTEDFIESSDAPDERHCPCTPEPAAPTMGRQLSAPGRFVLKGDGFYKPGVS